MKLNVWVKAVSVELKEEAAAQRNVHLTPIQGYYLATAVVVQIHGFVTCCFAGPKGNKGRRMLVEGALDGSGGQ